MPLSVEYTFVHVHHYTLLNSVSSLIMLMLTAVVLSIVSVSEGKKNILFIASDDLRPNLGVYDGVNAEIFNSPQMVTPNIDKLADKSILFERAYVQYAVCSPSRTSLLNGRRPDTTHVTDLESYFRYIGGNFTTIPQFFKNHGYKSINVGKIFHRGHDASGPGSGDDDVSWNEIIHPSPMLITMEMVNPGRQFQQTNCPFRTL